MTNNPLVVIVDSDALIAQANLTDAHHDRAILISKKLEELGAKVIYPSTVIFEATTLMHRWNKSGLDLRILAKGTLSIISEILVIIEPVDKEIIQAANEFYSPKASKADTTFDCVVAAVAEKYKADYIFSWDKFYLKHGFKLAQELI